MPMICKLVRFGEGDLIASLERRGTQIQSEVAESVRRTIEQVRLRGDDALLEHARRFDAPGLESLEVSEAELLSATLEPRYLDAIRLSIQRVRSFHDKQMRHMTAGLEPVGDGVFSWSEGGLGQRLRPLSAVGAYVPGGLASYPSSVIMNTTPALCAGVSSVAVATPARKDGSLIPAVLIALRDLGITKAFKVGGAGAVAALALGTESVPKVDKIVGPGNRYVNEAKRQLWGQVGLDTFAGPSEVCVLADDTANPEWAAADLLTQVEHAEDNAGFLVALSEPQARRILDCADRQMRGAPREATMREALAQHGLAIVARDMKEAIEAVNAIAPEHLTLAVEDPDKTLQSVHNAGCVLLGEHTPESAGDFVLGPSHTLPTATAARFGGPLNVLDFLKVQSVSKLTPEQLEPLVGAIEAFGEMEGFPAHGHGALIRRQK